MVSNYCKTIFTSLTFLTTSFTTFTAANAHAATSDLTTRQAFVRSCAALPQIPSALKTNQERQAYAICHDVALTKNIITFAKSLESRFKRSEQTMPVPVINLVLQTQLIKMRNELRNSRTALEKIQLKNGEGLLIKPAEWQLDLDSDGAINTWEKYFFAIPKPGNQAFDFRMPSDDPHYYDSEYQLDAQIRLDQSDVLWALSYHYFAEGLVEILLSYRLTDLEFSEHMIELRDPAGMKRAGDLITKGLKISDALRVSVLAETDDDQEWINNPSQKNTVFPIRLDDDDFQVWKTMLGHLIPLFEGKTVLAKDSKAAGPIASAAGFCGEGKGLSVPHFFNNPARYPLELMNPEKRNLNCLKVDSNHPASGLFDFLEHYNGLAEKRGNSPMKFLRHFFWVN